jgi:alpha-galactosidase
VVTSNGTIDVFFKDTVNNLEHAYTAGGVWHTAQLVNGGMGALGGDPIAVGQSTGVVDVFWRGTDNHVWRAYYDGGTWNGPMLLGGTIATS